MEDVFSFEEMTVEAIEKSIVGYVREIKKLREDKKDFVASVNEAVKDIESRIDSALDVLDKKKQLK